MTILQIFLLIFPFLIAIVLILIIRWARRKNSELNMRRHRVRFVDYWAELKNGNIEGAAKSYFFGTSPNFVAVIGKWLTALVILVALAILTFIFIGLCVRGT